MPYGTIVADKITTSDGYTLGGDGSHMKNRIINGTMVIDQRNAGVTANGTDALYTLDRWKITSYDGSAQTGKFSIQQNAGSITPPSGFINYLGITSNAATSVGSTGQYLLQQNIEGLNIADLAWGTSSAKTVTLSFWVRSSLTGTFGGSILNSGVNRSYPFSYTISSANTWTFITIVVPGDTSGTWLTTTAIGMRVEFSLGVGSSTQGPANTWASTRYDSVSGETKLVATNGATWYITGTQLEVGSTATSFDYRPYGTELQLCQRYYYSSGTGNQAYTVMGNGWEYSSTFAQVYCPLPTPMRVPPTSVSYSTLQTNNSAAGNPSVSSLSLATTECSTIAGKVNVTISGGTAGAVCMLRAANSTSGYIAFNAEL